MIRGYRWERGLVCTHHMATRFYVLYTSLRHSIDIFDLPIPHLFGLASESMEESER